jgi:hypothetical protein
MERKIRRGPTVDVFIDYDGGCCRSSRQHPQGAHHRTFSSTTMVAAAGAPRSTPRGPTVERLHRLRWWLLPELLTAPPGGPPSNVFINYDGGATRAPGSTPRGSAIDVWLKTWYLSPAFLLHDTYQGATMANTTTTGRTKFHRKIFLEKG